MPEKTKTLLTLVPREVLGKKVRRLRREGVTPCNIYGNHVESVAVQMPTEELRHLLKTHGRNEIVYVQMNGDERPTFLRDIQRNPVTDEILHVDFYQISLSETVRMEVPIHLVGESPAVETYGGVLIHQLNTVMVEALPTSVPSSIEVDVSGLLELDQSLHVSDIAAPEGVTILQDPEAVIASVAIPAAERAEEMEEAEAAEEGAPEGEEAAPAEAAEGEEQGE